MCKLCADDCKIYGVIDLPRNTSTIQSDLNDLRNWSEYWQLPFNESKCKAIHFGFHNPKIDYKLNNHTLEVVHEEKDLGIIIDDTLRFHQQTACVVKKANQVLGVIKKSFNTRDEITITTLFKSMVRPHLEYANAIWGPHFQADIIKVESVESRATKMIYGLTNLPYQERLKTLKLPSLVYRRRRGNMIQIFKILNDYVRIDKNQFFKIREHAIRLPKKE